MASSTTHYWSPGDAWASTVTRLLQLNPGPSPRGQATLELDGPQTLVVNEPWRMPLAAEGRDFRHAITAAEGLSLVGQTSVPEVVLDKVAAFRPFMRNSVFWGAYGPRVAGDLGQLVDLLGRDPDSRQAVLSLYQASRDLGRSEQVDVPCTVAVQFTVRRGALQMWVVMRSNDAWLGLPYDLGQFEMLHQAVAQALGVPAGRYTHSAGSMHLYLRDVEKAARVDQAEPARVFQRPWWGGDGTIASTSSRARRILLGQASRLEGLTDMESFMADQLA